MRCCTCCMLLLESSSSGLWLLLLMPLLLLLLCQSLPFIVAAIAAHCSCCSSCCRRQRRDGMLTLHMRIKLARGSPITRRAAAQGRLLAWLWIHLAYSCFPVLVDTACFFSLSLSLSRPSTGAPGWWTCSFFSSPSKVVCKKESRLSRRKKNGKKI